MGKLEAEVAFRSEYRGMFLGKQGANLQKLRDDHDWGEVIRFDFPKELKNHIINIAVLHNDENRDYQKTQLESVTNQIRQLHENFQERHFRRLEYNYRKRRENYQTGVGYALIVDDTVITNSTDSRFQGYSFEMTECFKKKKTTGDLEFPEWITYEDNKNQFQNILFVDPLPYDNQKHKIKSTLKGTLTMHHGKTISAVHPYSHKLTKQLAISIPDTLSGSGKRSSDLMVRLERVQRDIPDLSFQKLNSPDRPTVSHIDTALRYCTAFDVEDCDVVLSASAFAYFFSRGHRKNTRFIVKFEKISKSREPILYLETSDDVVEESKSTTIMASFMQRLKSQQNGPIDEHYHMFKVSFTKEYSQLRALVVTTEILTSINGTTADIKENHFDRVSDCYRDQNNNFLAPPFCDRMMGKDVSFNGDCERFLNHENCMVDLKRQENGTQKMKDSLNDAYLQSTYFKMKATNSKHVVHGVYQFRPTADDKRVEENKLRRKIYRIQKISLADLEQDLLHDKNHTFQARPDLDLDTFVRLMRSMFISNINFDGVLQAVVDINTKKPIDYLDCYPKDYSNNKRQGFFVSGRIRVYIVDEAFIKTNPNIRCTTFNLFG